MDFRLAVKDDIDDIMKIIRQAQAFLKELGIDQWQNNYPNQETILKDIEQNNSYILLEDHQIIATVAVSFNGEKTYDQIYEGQWVSNKEYAVIHRIAVESSRKGLGLSSIVLKEIETLCRNFEMASIKVDTHEGNLPMQNLLRKNDFMYCGIIYLEDGNKRMAFEKILN